MASTLKPRDYGRFLLHSKDLASIMLALKHPHPATRGPAIKALYRAWIQLPPEETLQAVGGAAGLAEILDTASYDDARTIVSYLGRSYLGPSDRRTQTLEQLVTLLLPSLSTESLTHTVSRLGPALVSRLIPVLPPTVVNELLRFVKKEDTGRLSQLLYNNPAYAADLLQAQKFDNPAIRFDNKALKWLFAQRSISHPSTDTNKHWGIQLLINVIDVQESHRNIFNPSLKDLFGYATAAIKNAPTVEEYFGIIESILRRAEKEQVAGNDVEFDDVRQMVLRLALKLARAVKKRSEDRINLISGYVARLGRIVSGGQSSSTLNEGGQVCLRGVAPSIRLRFLRLLHNLSDGQQWKFPEDWSRISAPLLILLTREDGEPILRQMDASLEKPESIPTIGSITAERVKAIIELLKDEPRVCRDAVNVAIRGCWAFSQNDAVSQEKTREDMGRWKQLVHRQKDLDTRRKYVDALLTMAGAIGDLLILKELLSWAFERFLKVRAISYSVSLESGAELLSSLGRRPTDYTSSHPRLRRYHFW
jgi:hypothetical protein